MKRFIARNFHVTEPPAIFERQHSATTTMKNKLCLGYVVTVFKNITVQGLVHFTYTRRHFAEHIIWIVTLVLCLLCTISLCNQTWRRYKDNPTVISLERDSMAWNVSFPSIFICPASKYDEMELDKLVANLAVESSVPAHTLKSYMKALANLTYDNMHEMKQFENITGLPEKGLLDKVLQIQFKFEHRYESEEKNPFHKRLFKVMTETGICYAQNSLLAPVVALEKTDVQNMTINPVTFTQRAKKILEISQINTDYKVFVESSTEVPTWLSVPRVYKHKYETILSITVRTMYSTDDVRELDVHHRKCRFFDESDLKISPKYSYNLCMMQCRKDMVEKWCHCSPYFYGKLDNFTECGVKGMLCIAKLTDKLKGLSDKICKCYRPCDVDNYGILKEKVTAIIGSTELFGGTRLEWELPEFPNIRLKKDILFSSTNLLEAFGGTVNLFLGASILSGIEVIYYCTIRLVFYLFKQKNSLVRHVRI